MKKRMRAFNLLLDDELAPKLVELADAAHRSKGSVVRDLIRAAWLTTKTRDRRCADGRRCVVPVRGDDPESGG